MKLKIIFDDKKEAERIILDDSDKEPTFFELCMVAKYYKGQGMGFAKIRKEIIKLCKKRNPNFNVITNRQLLRGVVNNSKNFKLRENVEKVMITESEVEALQNIDYKYAKVLFVMLVVAKREKFMTTRVSGKKRPPEKLGYFFNYPISSAISLAGIRMSKKEVNKMLYFLDGQNGFIQSTVRSTRSWRVKFADDKSQVKIIVDNFDDITGFLPFYCKKCGKKVEKKFRHDMCAECYKEWRNKGRLY